MRDSASVSPCAVLKTVFRQQFLISTIRLGCVVNVPQYFPRG